MKRRIGMIAAIFSLSMMSVFAVHAVDCKAISNKLLDNLDQGNSDAAVVDFNAEMKAGLSPAQLKQFWQRLPQKLGVRGARENARLVQQNVRDIVVTPLHFSTGIANAVVVCSPEGQISGFHVIPQQ